MVLGTWSRKDRLYDARLQRHLQRRPGRATRGRHPAAARGRRIHRRLRRNAAQPAFTPPPPDRHIAEGSFFVGDDSIIRQVEDGQAVPVTYGGVLLKADGTRPAGDRPP